MGTGRNLGNEFDEDGIAARVRAVELDLRKQADEQALNRQSLDAALEHIIQHPSMVFMQDGTRVDTNNTSRAREQNFIGATVARNATDRSRMDITVAAGFGPFCYDYLISTDYTGTEGASTTNTDSTFSWLTYSTIDGAMAHAAALSSGSPRSFFICPGTYTEAVGRTPPSASPWTIHGIRRRTLWLTDASFCYASGNQTGSPNALHFRGISFNVQNNAIPAITHSTTVFQGSVEDCDFSGDNSNSSGILLSKSSGILQVTNCLFEGSGHGIRGNSAVQTNVQITGCWFLGRIGINPQRSVYWTITGNWFNCTDWDIIEDGDHNSEVAIVGNTFRQGVKFAGVSATSNQNLVIADNTFSNTGSVTLLDLGSVTTASIGITVTGNTFLGDSSTTGIDLSDAEIGAGLCANNTFKGFASGSEILTTGIGSNFDVFHNLSDAGAIADVGSPVGHVAAEGDIPGHGTTPHTEFGNWKAFYSDGSGDQQELALGSAGKVFASTGVATAPAFANWETYISLGMAEDGSAVTP